MTTVPGSPIDRLLTLFLVVAPVVYLAATITYAVRGWDDPTAAVLHVLGAIAWGLALLRLVTWLPGAPGWAAALLVIGTVGVAGNVAYGFNTIHVSLGDTDLVDASGAATLIKPLGLCFPLMLLVAAVGLALTATGPRWVAAVTGLAGLVWPVAFIADIGWLAVAVNAALLVVGSALFAGRPVMVDDAAASGHVVAAGG